MINRLRVWLSPIVYLSNNWISLIGVVFVTLSTVTWITLLPVSLRGGITHPYIGMLVYLLLPGIFIGSLALIPAGIYLQRRRQNRLGSYPASFPPLDLQSRELRKLIAFVGVATVLNVIIASQFTYSAVRYMDTVTFCGTTCHTVMKPEYTAYLASPHARVECVNCHIGSGASWFVRSKFSGMGQVFGVLLHNYPTPIPTPVHNLRPARETCETCHWPQKFGEDRVRDIPAYGDDEQNTLTHTVLMLHVGGGVNRMGIHGRHLGQGVQVRYMATDDRRQTIPWVEYTAEGKTAVYATTGTTVDQSKVRVMDCMDCHNRPSHLFQLPERAMDQALYKGDIAANLPFVKKQSVAILKQAYATEGDAMKRIPAAFEDYYRTNYPQVYAEHRDDVTRSAQKLLAVFERNVFPEMKITWGTYPNNVGHTDFDGCFRCHDEQHNSAGGRSITQDCSACHNLLATGEKSPAILKQLGFDSK